MQARSPAVFPPEFLRLLALQPLGGFTICVFYLLPKFLTADLHASASEVGLVSAAFGAGSLLSVPFVSFCVARGWARGVLGAATLMLTVTALAFLGVHRMGPLVLALRAVQGFAYAVMFTAGMIFTARLSPPERLAEAIGYYGSANLAMNAIAPVIAEGAADTWGWSAVFVMAALSGLVGCVLTRRLPVLAASARADAASTWSVLRRQSSQRMVAVVALWGNAFGVMFTFYQPFALALGIHHVRSFFLAYTLAALFSRLGTGHLPDRFGRRRVAVGSLALYGLVVLAMQYLRVGWLAPLGGVFGLAHGLFFPAYSALTVEGVTPHEQGKVMALSNAAFNAGFAMSGLVFGPVAERFGFRAVFLIAGLATWAAVALLVGGRGEPRPLTAITEQAT